MLGIIVYSLYGLLFAIKKTPIGPTCPVFIPIFGTVRMLFIGIYAIGIDTMGAVIGDYLVRDGV